MRLLSRSSFVSVVCGGVSLFLIRICSWSVHVGIWLSASLMTSVTWLYPRERCLLVERGIGIRIYVLFGKEAIPLSSISESTCAARL